MMSVAKLLVLDKQLPQSYCQPRYLFAQQIKDSLFLSRQFSSFLLNRDQRHSMAFFTDIIYQMSINGDKVL
jgi:hypothetical protein